MSAKVTDTVASLISEALEGGSTTVPELAGRLVAIVESACYAEIGFPALLREIRRAELARRLIQRECGRVGQEIGQLSMAMMIMNSVADVEGQDPAYAERKRLQRDKLNALYVERELLRHADQSAAASLDAALALLPPPASDA